MDTKIGLDTFGRSPFTSALVDLFRKTKPGEVVTYKAIDTALGISRKKWSGLLDTARKVLRREHRIVLRTERGVGYKHLPDPDVVGTGEEHARHIRRRAKRALEELTGVKDYASLAPTVQVEVNTRLAQLATVAHIASRPAERQLREATEVHNSRIDVGKTLGLLRG